MNIPRRRFSPLTVELSLKAAGLSLMAVEFLMDETPRKELLYDELRIARNELKQVLGNHKLIVTPAGVVFSKPSRRRRG